MVSTFNLEKLQLLLIDFYTLTKIRITVFNDHYEEILRYPEPHSNFCQLIRTDPEAGKTCRQCDINSCSTVAERHSGCTYKCHAGLTEAIVPISVETKVIGYLFFGQIFCYPSHKEGWNNIKKCCKSYNIDMSLLEKITSGLPIIPEEYIASASHLLKAVAAYLSIDHLVMVVKSDLAVQINDYIYAHLNEPLGVKNICTNFKIGKTHLYKISQELFGTGIAEHIGNLRIERAKVLLLEDPEAYIKEICFSCGFNNYAILSPNTGVLPVCPLQNSEVLKEKTIRIRAFSQLSTT